MKNIDMIRGMYTFAMKRHKEVSKMEDDIIEELIKEYPNADEDHLRDWFYDKFYNQKSSKELIEKMKELNAK